MSAAAKPQARASNPKTAPAEGRKDPRPRPIGGSVQFDVVARDPRFHYVGVFRGDDNAWADYQFKGYQPVEFQPGGPRIRGCVTCKPGEQVEYKGHVLMALPKDEYDLQFKESQARGDVMSNQMIGGKAARKIGNANAPVINETTALLEEIM